MAKIAGKDVLISVNMGTPEAPDWMKVACSTSDGFNGTTDTVTVNSKCTEGWTDNEPGNKSWSFSNSSYAETEPDSDALSYDEVFALWAADETRQWKIEGITSDYYRMGLGFITDLSETAADGDYLTFDLTITGKGEVTNVPPTT